MNYTEAVHLAQSGVERGFGYLYQNTYKSKYYLALQYMKNEEEAQDVLQEAYIRAFSRLDMLRDPEMFPAWLGSIVANTAKNMLAKRNPMLFSEMAIDMESEGMEYQIEDDRLDYRPETAYTRQETRELVHELIESLSEEQRLCILMFHIEGASIREIAEVMNCPENTVKSRLNYGRKNLRVKAEELKKKGYKLYGVAPIPLLLYLLRTDARYMAGEGAFVSVGKIMADYIFSMLPPQPGYVPSGNGERIAAEGMKSAAAKTAKSGFLHTAAGKAVVTAIGICAVGGASIFGISQMNQGAQPQETVQEEEASQPTKAAETTREEEPQEEQAAQETEEPQGPKEMTDGDYASMVAGNLTKEELEYVLAYGPEEIPVNGFADRDYQLLLNSLCQGTGANGNPIENYGTNEKWQPQYSQEDVNRIFLSFTPYQFTEENDNDAEEYGIHVDGDRIVFSPATLNYSAYADITSAEYTEGEMNVYFNYERTSGDGSASTSASKKAVLNPDETGMYRIVKIEEAAQPAETDSSNTATEQTAVDQGAENGASMEEIYRGVLQSVQNQEAGYEFPDASGQIEGYEYFVYDLNGDGIEELIVGAVFSENVFMMHDCRVFSCTQAGSGYELKVIGGHESVTSLYLASDGNGLLTSILSRGTGQTDVYRITIQNDTLVRGSSEYQFIMGSSEASQFNSANASVQWKSISDQNIFG